MPATAELLVDELAHGHSPVASLARGGRRDGRLAGVHVHGRSLTQPDRCPQANSAPRPHRELMSPRVVPVNSEGFISCNASAESMLYERLKGRWHNGK